MDKINFYLPGIGDLYTFNLNYNFFKYLSSHKEYMNESFEIAGFYGSFENMIWNGGRVNNGVQLEINQIREVLSAMARDKIRTKFTFTNSLLNESHLYDTYCNAIMENIVPENTDIIINSILLENYLRKKYSGLRYIYSTTACVRDVNKINDLSQIYDCVVIDYRDNKNQDFISSIKDKSKIEILVDEYCPADCPFRAKHYENLSKYNLMMIPSTEAGCMYIHDNDKTKYFFSNVLKNRKSTLLTVEEIYEYHKLGFNEFKLNGRSLPANNVFESYLYYLIKPEYRDFVREDFLSLLPSEMSTGLSARVPRRDY